MKTKLPTHKTVTRVCLFIVSVLLIVYFIPTEDENHYNYEVNRPWSYSLLTAPFDIPIHLDSIHVRMAKDSIDREFEPVFKRDVTAEKIAVSEYASRLTAAQDLQITPAERNALLAEIRRIYENGIVDQETYAKIENHTLPSVRFIHDNTAMSVPTSSYYSARTAYTHLDSLFRDPRFLDAITKTRLSDVLQPNITLDSLESKRMRDEMYQRATAPIGVIQQGERIIDKGDIVTLQLATVLDTFEELASERGTGSLVSQTYYPIAGQALFIILMLAALYSYLYFFRRKYFEDNRSMLMMMVVVTCFTIAAYLVIKESQQALYLIPFTMVPIMLLIFLDSRTAFLAHIVTTLLASVVSTFPLEFIFMQYIAGVAAIDSIKDLSRRSQLVKSAAIIFVAYSLSYVAMEVMQAGTIDRIQTKMFGYFAINAVLISFAYILVFLLEKVFGFTSRVTLVELSDTNNALLRQLSEDCPGTFQHSMSVSNLAAAAAAKIGANELLVRAGALYHDIGKIRMPAFFTENQHGVNPHEALNDPKRSAQIVINHVTDGLKMADKANLPAVIRDFISQHHGRGKAKYFYNTYCNAHPGEEVDESAFTYPGPNPQTKETSILMMADSVEAASRSLTDHSPEAIQKLVNRIIDGQIAEGLHSESPISFLDIKKIKEVFASRLRTMFHSRISYPDLKKSKTEETAPEAN